MEVTINSNVKQESIAFQKDNINSFNTSTYGKLRTNETNTEIRFNIVVLAAVVEQTDCSVIMSQTWSPTATMIMTWTGQKGYLTPPNSPCLNTSIMTLHDSRIAGRMGKQYCHTYTRNMTKRGGQIYRN